MNPAPQSEDWLDAVQARRISPEQLVQVRRQLASRPRETARLDEELALNAILDGLPPASVPSNFLARVQAGIATEERAAARRSNGWSRWLRGIHFLRPIAALAVLAMALTGWWQFRVQQRTALASSVSVVSQTVGIPGIESLRDFDAVQLLRTTGQPGDVELLAVLDTDSAAATP